MSYSDPVVSTYNRAFLTELRCAMGIEAYIDHIWKARENERLGSLPADQCRTTAGNGWPYDPEAAQTELPPVVVRMHVERV